jgi:hypothetical protein
MGIITDSIGPVYDRAPQASPAGILRPGVVLIVVVAKDGGVAGDETTDCSWTYTVKDMAGTTMPKNAAGDAAEDIEPVKPRLTHVQYTYAGDGTTTYALACYDGSGNLVLLDCLGEVPVQIDCTPT